MAWLPDRVETWMPGISPPSKHLQPIGGQHLLQHLRAAELGAQPVMRGGRTGLRPVAGSAGYPQAEHMSSLQKTRQAAHGVPPAFRQLSQITSGRLPPAKG